MNLVRHSATSPSISAATSSSYPPPPPTPPSYNYTTPLQQVQNVLPSNYGHPQFQPSQQPPQHNPYQSSVNTYQQQPSHLYQQQPASLYQQQQQPLPPIPITSQGYYHTPTATPITPTYYQQQIQQGQGPMLSPQQMPPQMSDTRPAPSGMFTRNLIGSLCVSAFKLTDPDNKLGIWFILQDLSVRTEGSFRFVAYFSSILTGTFFG